MDRKLKETFPIAGGEAQDRTGGSVPPEGVFVLPFGAQVEGMAGGQHHRRLARVPHRQTAQAVPALGAHLHRHTERSSLRRTAHLGGKERQDDSGE